MSVMNIPEPTVDEPYHTIQTVAKMFGVKSETVRTWIRTERIKGVKVMGRWHIPHAEVIRVTNEEYGND